MLYRKYVALFTAMLVGFGVVATDAATVSSVTILSPADSGALRGIDSTFSVQAKLLDFTVNDSLEVIFYLVTGTDSTVVADGQNLVSGSGPGLATQVGRALSGKKVRNAAGLMLNSTSVAAPSDAGALIAVRATRGWALVSTSVAAPSAFSGDADSVRAVDNGDTTTFTWYGKIHHSSGTENGVRAAVLAIDSADTTAPKVTATSLKLNIDADRPINPTSIVYSAGASARGNKTGSPDLSVNVTGAIQDKILGIGDSLKLNIKLGSSTDGVLIGDSL